MATLDEWEQRLRSQMGAIELIGELDLAPEEVQEIGRLIAVLIRSQGPPSAIRNLEQRYPATLAAFLVFQGGNSYHSDEKGDFWPGVCQAVGIPYAPSYTMELGQAFERICDQFRLTHEFSGHRYVSAILGHGGIPARSLPDFFEHLLQPSITKPELATFSTTDLIQEWLTGSAQYHVDKPILRFLEHGGKVAEDFVERCRQMARAWMKEGEFPTADELGLPVALVDAYHEWVTQSGLVRSEAHSGLRLKKPVIALDPWGLGVYVVLPEQQIPAAQSLAESWWEVEADGAIDRIPVDARRVGMDLKTRIAHAILRRPAPEYKVWFYRRAEEADRMLREWVYAGVSDAHPFLVFDPATGRLMPQPKCLPARPLWILCSPDATLQSDPISQSLIREELPRLPWDWHPWRGYGLDLQGISALKLSAIHGQALIPVMEAPAAPTAELVNAEQLGSLDDPVPIFAGVPPTLRIYIPEEDLAGGRLTRWRLELNHEWNADPERSLRARLSELDDLIVRRDGCIELSLAHPNFLGPAPVGQYRIRLRGPLGRNADLRFRVAPKLYLTGHEGLYLPEPEKGAPIALLLIETDAQSQIELLEDAPDFRVELLSCDAQARCYQVTVPRDRADAPLRLVRHVPSGRHAYIPLRIPIRRLRWLLILKPEQVAQVTWQSQPSAINLAELEQSPSPCLMLELPVSESSQVVARLRFLDVNGDAIAELEAPRPTGSRSWRRFDLRSVRDALRESPSPAVQVVLKVEGLPEHDPLILTVLTLRRSITVERTSINLRQLDDDQYLAVSWEPEIPLRDRCIRLWSQTRPWTEPLLLPIPDSAKGSQAFPIQADTLPAGHYLVEFLVHDPWLPETTPARPEPTAPHVVTVTIGSLEERLACLEAARWENGDVFSCACESAFLWRALGDTARAEASLQACWQGLDTASLPQMMALARKFQDLPTGKAFWIKLYRTEQIRQVFAAYSNGDLPESVVAEYLAYLPPLTKLAPQAVEALLEAPDARVQLAAARHLIEQDNIAGIRAAFAWEASGRLSRQDLDELLSLNLPLATDYAISHLPPEESLRLLQTSDQRDLQLALAASLVRCDCGEGVLAVARLYERKAISAPQAVAALGINPRFAARSLHSLWEQLPGKAIRELLDKLLDAHPAAIPVIQAGVWVHCHLGWAQIACVETGDGQRIESLLPDRADQGVRFTVTFHPGPDAIKALIDPSRQQILLLGVNRVYQCLKCHQYIAVRYEKITGEHDKTKHEGVHPSFRPLESPISLVGRLEFRHRPPAS
uniref:Uncharacterized protein n=1 Tax=Caldilinea aerophila TaxID=133453 RepID=A0A7C1FDK5_9CHLR